MALLDKPLRDVSKKVIDLFGTRVFVRRNEVGEYVVANGAAAESPVEFAINGIYDQIKSTDLVGDVKMEDRKLIVPAVDLKFTPTLFDEIIDGDVVMTVIRNEPVSSGDQTALHVLFLRGSGVEED